MNELAVINMFNVYFVRVENILKKAVVVWKESMLSFDFKIFFGLLVLFFCCLHCLSSKDFEKILKKTAVVWKRQLAQF